MLPSLMPLLCRHDFYWSERHRSDRCRRCGKLQADSLEAAAAPSAIEAREPVVLDRIPPATAPQASKAAVPGGPARGRRESLTVALQRLIDGRHPSRDETLDLVLAMMEDAHSSDPVLFGPDAAEHFARLHATRSSAARLASVG